MKRCVVWTAGSLLVAAALLSACGGRSGPRPADSVTPSPEVVVSVTPPAGTKLSVDEAIQIARDRSMFVDPETLQQTTVKLSSGVWNVIFKGMFYEPSGPAPLPT